METFQKEKEIIAVHCCQEAHFVALSPINNWKGTRCGQWQRLALSMGISEQMWSRTQRHNSYLAVYYFFVIKTKFRIFSKSLKRFLSLHVPLHIYIPALIPKNTEKKSVILHFFVHSHCHTLILNTTVKNPTKAINPEKFRFWLSMMKS